MLSSDAIFTLFQFFFFSGFALSCGVLMPIVFFKYFKILGGRGNFVFEKKKFNKFKNFNKV